MQECFDQLRVMGLGLLLIIVCDIIYLFSFLLVPFGLKNNLINWTQRNIAERYVAWAEKITDKWTPWTFIDKE